MRTNKQYFHFTKDIVELLKEKTIEAKLKGDEESSEIDFSNGYSMAYYEVLSLFIDQAKAFDIPLDEIGLSSFELDNLLK